MEVDIFCIYKYKKKFKNLPGFDSDEDLALSDCRFRFLEDLDGLETAEASEHDSAHLLGRRALLLLFLGHLLRGLFRGRLGAPVLGGGLLGRGGRRGIRVFRHSEFVGVRYDADNGREENEPGQESEAGRRDDASRNE